METGKRSRAYSSSKHKKKDSYLSSDWAPLKTAAYMPTTCKYFLFSEGQGHKQDPITDPLPSYHPALQGPRETFQSGNGHMRPHFLPVSDRAMAWLVFIHSPLQRMLNIYCCDYNNNDVLITNNIVLVCITSIPWWLIGFILIT